MQFNTDSNKQANEVIFTYRFPLLSLTIIILLDVLIKNIWELY